MLITLNTESLEKHYNQSIVNFANTDNQEVTVVIISDYLVAYIKLNKI